ncbi:MAG TPA: hypothetical protein VGK16_05450 [Candidatus Limnocylindrales bacterium]|jgi:hypothetical protein
MRYEQLRGFKLSREIPAKRPLTRDERAEYAILIGRSVKQVERTEKEFESGRPPKPAVDDRVYTLLAANHGNRLATHAQLGAEFGKSYDAFCDRLARHGDPAVLIAARYGSEAIKYWVPTKIRPITDPLELYTQDTVHIPMRARLDTGGKTTEELHLEVSWSPGARMHLNCELFVGVPNAQLAAAVLAGTLTGVGSGDPINPRIGGLCDTNLTDRASIYLSEHWRRLHTGAKIIPAYGKPHVPQEKADEERSFRSIQEGFLSQLAGFLGSRFPSAWVGDRQGSPAHRVAREELPTVAEIRLAIFLWMDTFRSTHIHPVFKTTSLARWNAVAAPRARFLDPALAWDFAIPAGTRIRQGAGLFLDGYREPIPADPDRRLDVRDVVCVRHLPGPRTLALFGDARERYIGYAPFHADLTEQERVAADVRNAFIGRDARRILRLAKEEVRKGSRLVNDALPTQPVDDHAAEPAASEPVEPPVGPRKEAAGKRLASRCAALKLARVRVR